MQAIRETSVIDDIAPVRVTAGSVLEAMATAVEKATVVVVCLSQKYKDSPSCRTGKFNFINLYYRLRRLKTSNSLARHFLLRAFCK